MGPHLRSEKSSRYLGNRTTARLAIQLLKTFAPVLELLAVGGVLIAVSLLGPFKDVETIAIPLTAYPGDEVDPVWSPDGRSIAFMPFAVRAPQLFVIPIRCRMTPL